MQASLAFGSFLFFTALVGAIAWWRTRRLDNRDAQNYFLAGRKLPWIQVAGALLLTNLSTEQLIGLNGAASIHGAVVMAWEIVPVFALIAMAWYFLPRYWSGNITTIPEFLEQRFDRPTRRLLGAILLVTLTVNFLPFVLYSGGLAMSSIFRLPELLGISQSVSFAATAWAIGLIGGIYVVFGGMKAVALSDTLYGVGLVIGALLIPVFGLIQLGGGDFSAGLTRVFEQQGAKLNPVGDSGSNVPFSTLFTGMLFINMFYWCTNQVIVQRSFGASSFAEAQKGILATAALKLIGPFYLVLPGIIAVELFGSAIGNGDLAYSMLVETVLPDYLVGFFAAVLLGSIVSSFNGGLHSASTLFSLDLYRAWLRPAADERAMLKAGKLFAVVVCLASIFVSGMLGGAPEGVFTLMKRIMAAFNIPLLSVVAMGMLNLRVPAWAAKTALVGGVGLGFGLNALLGGGAIGLTVHWLHIAAINAVLLCGFLYIAGKLSPAAVAARPTGLKAPAAGASAMATDLTPWGGLRVATVIVGVLAVAFYAVLWFFTRSHNS